MGMNKVFILGHLTQDVTEGKVSRHGEDLTMVRGTLAVNNRRSKRGTVNFIPFIAIGASADFIKKYCGSKGSGLLIEGHYQNRKVLNEEAGTSTTYRSVIVDKASFGDGDMNIAILVGRLTADPELRYTQDGKAVGRFSMALDRGLSAELKQSGVQAADFVDVTAFGPSAEFIERYFHKGLMVHVEGSLEAGSYQGKDGKTVYTLGVTASDLGFAQKKSSETISSQNSFGAVAGTGTDGFEPLDATFDEVVFQ